jgi:hypothetical protein
VVLSDDNFSAAGASRVNQFITFELDPAAR